MPTCKRTHKPPVKFLYAICKKNDEYKEREKLENKMYSHVCQASDAMYH